MADLDITVGLNDRASRQLRNIDKAAKSLSTTLKTAGAAAAAFASHQVVTGVINQYRAFERYRTVLKTYLGSAKAANQELDRLSKLANKLPQTLDDVTQAFTIFTRFGLDTSSKSLTAFSNIATANAKSLTQLGEAVADALTGEFERLKEFGIKVAKENGQFVARVGEDQVALAETTTDLVRQLKALGEEGGRWGSAAADNATTLDQSFSNLSGAIFNTSVQIGEGLRPELRKVINDMTDLINKNDQLAKDIGIGLGEAVKTTAAGVKVLAENFDLIRNAALALIAVRLFSAFQTIGSKLAFATGNAKTATAVFGRMGAVLAGMAKAPLVALGKLSRFLGPGGWLVAGTIAATTAATEYQDTLFKVGNTTTSIGQLASGTWNLMGDGLRRLADYFINVWSGITTWFSGILRDKQSMFNRSFDRIASVVRSFANFYLNTWVAIGTSVITIIRNIPQFFAEAFRGSIRLISEFGNAAVTKFTQIGDAIRLAMKGDFGGAWAKLGEDSGYDFINSFQQSFKDVPNLLGGIDYSQIYGVDRVGQMSEWVSGKIEEMVIMINDAAVPAMDNAAQSADYYEDRIQRLAKAQTNLQKKTADANKETEKQGITWKEVGDNIEERLLGLTDSISNSLTNVVMGVSSGFDALKDIAMSVISTIVNELIKQFVVGPLMKNIASSIGSAFGGIGGGLGGGGGIFGALGGAIGGNMLGFGMLGGIGLLLGGLFADGGSTARAGRKPIVVGEKGPEVFLPQSAGAVIPNDELNNGNGGALTVNFNLQAIDTQTGVEFLLDNKRVITGVVQDAYRRRGAAGPLG